MKKLIAPFILATLIIFPAYGRWDKQTIRIHSCVGVVKCEKGSKEYKIDDIRVPRNVVIPPGLPLDTAAHMWLAERRPGAVLQAVALHAIALEDASN